MASHKPGPWSCDSSLLGLGVRSWLVEAATAADFKGVCGGQAPQPKKVNDLFSSYFASQDTHSFSQFPSIA